MEARDNYGLLVEKLDQFIRKYYVNQLIRGGLYFIGAALLLFLAVSLAEYYFNFDTTGRKILFFGFIGTSLIMLAAWVFRPLLSYFKLGSIISHEQAAQIIGDHFSNVKDKLLNVLQLRSQADSAENKALILASINQKSEEIKPVPFQSAIDLQKNRQYLKYALPPLLVLLVLLLAAPTVIKDPTRRLIRNNQAFTPPAPFHFKVVADDLSVVQFGDFKLEVEIDGDQLPNEVYIDVDNYQYRLTKDAANRFSHQFSNVQKDTRFSLFASGVNSEEYTLEVLKKPNIATFEVSLDYPAYLGRKDETLDNIGDITVPVGTQIKWVFNALQTDELQIVFSDEKEIRAAKRFDDDFFSMEKRAMRDMTYKLFVSNAQLPLADSIGYSLSVIPDLYPEINVEVFQDSSIQRLVYFIGDASDDYGLSSLQFHYRITSEDGKEQKPVSIPVEIAVGKATKYDYTFDINELNLAPGDNVTYYFEVFDNDGVNGRKSSRTSLMTYAMPTKEELAEKIEQNEEKIKENLEAALKETKEIQDRMKEMREQLLQEKELDWQDRKELERMLERQKELQQQIEEAQQQFEENIQNQEQLSPQEQRIQEKQQQLQKMFEESISEEMQELMKQIEELLQELNKDEALEKLEEMELSDEELEMELDRMMEMYKQLELEQDMQETIEQLEELAEKQEELAEQTKDNELPQEELQEKQEEINKEFEEIQEKMEEMKEKNEELENPMEMGDFEEQSESIEEELNDSEEQLEQQNNSGASQSQKKAGAKMKSMAGMMSMQMQSQEMEQMEEDMQALRQLLENLVTLSFDQENLIADFDEVNINTPRYVGLVQQQFKLKDDFKLIQDSLHALSKRVYQIESFVTEKVTEIRSNMRESVEELEERRVPQASEHQQRTMTNVNDLALMLSEVLNQMQQQMSGMMSGNQMCNNPGDSPGNKPGSKPGDKMSPGQQSLNESLQQMKKAMQDGKGPTSKEFAQMAARQAALRQALSKKQAERQQQGKGADGKLQELIDEMNKSEEDLVNKRLTNEMLERQQDILNRLLEHEKAERQQDQDERRKSDTARQRERELPPSLQEYLKQREAEIDMFKTVSPALKPYYKYLVDEYFNTLRVN
ncbi:MAG: DUF4175 family protein [Saprospiraceae bacterium]